MVSRSLVVPSVIAGKELVDSPDSDLIFPVDCPFTAGEALYLARGVSSKEAVTALDASYEGFLEWKQYSYLKKREIFNKAADLLSERREHILEILKDMALPDFFAENNVQSSIDLIREAGCLTSSPPGSLAQAEFPNVSMVVDEPLGPILSIVPWNAPLVLCARAVVWPLAAGCSVVLKTSEHSPLVHYELVRVLLDAGVPPATLSLVNVAPKHAPAITKLLIEHKSIRKINFTGSTNVGKIIAQTAAGVLKPVLLELGGKCASIVTETANLSDAARAVVTAGFAHNGQVCMSTERVFVVEEVYDQFLKELVKAADEITNTVQLPLRTSQFAQRVESLLASASKHGAEVVYGELTRKDAFLKPMILANVDESNPLFDVESFGPTFYVSKVPNTQEAVNFVNKSDYGLSCGFWTAEILHAVNFARQIDSGAVHINGLTIHDEPVLPHGGVKSSGFGRFNSTWGLKEFQYQKSITIAPPK